MMEVEREIIEKSYAKLKEATGYLCDDKENDYDCALDELYNAAKQSVVAKSATSEDVAEAIKRFEQRNNSLKEVQDNGDAGCVDIETWEKYQGFIEDNNLAITALQAYQPTISKTETTSCEWCEIARACEYEVTFFKDDDRWATERSLLPKYCPNCGRRLED